MSAQSIRERIRLECEVSATCRAPGVGQGWRLNVRGRRYPVREPGPVDVDRMIAESDDAAARIARRIARRIA